MLLHAALLCKGGTQGKLAQATKEQGLQIDPLTHDV